MRPPPPSSLHCTALISLPPVHRACPPPPQRPSHGIRLGMRPQMVDDAAAGGGGVWGKAEKG